MINKSKGNETNRMIVACVDGRTIAIIVCICLSIQPCDKRLPLTLQYLSDKNDTADSFFFFLFIAFLLFQFRFTFTYRIISI